MDPSARPARTLLAGCLLALACRGAPSEPRADDCPRWAPVKYRSLVEVGDRVLPLFDLERPPRAEGRSLPIRLLLDEPPRDGLWEARVEVPGDGGQDCSSEALWGQPPDGLPAVAAAQALRRRGKLEAVRALLDEALEHPEPREALWLSVERARTLAASGEEDAAISAWTESASFAEQMGFITEVTRRELAAAYFAVRRHRLSQAYALLSSAETRARRYGDQRMLANALYQRGVMEGHLGDLHLAARLYRSSLEILEAIDARSDVPAVASELSGLEAKLGRQGSAFALMQKALAHIDELSTTHRASLLNNQAVILCMARVEVDAEQLQSCVRLVERAIELAKEDGRRSDETLYRANLTHLLNAQHRYEASLGILEQLNRDAENDWIAKVPLLTNEGEAHLGLGQLARAARAFERLLAFARDDATGASDPSWIALYGLARVAEARGNLDEAAALYAKSLSERRRAAARATISATHSTFLAARTELVDRALGLALRMNDPNRAFRIADDAQAETLRTLKASLRRSRLGPDQQAELLRRMGRYQSARSEYEATRREANEISPKERRSWHQRRRAVREELAAQVDELYAWLDQVAPVAAERRASLEAVQARLAPDEALLLVAPLGQDHVAFFITASSVAHEPVDDEAHPLARWPLAGTRRHLYVVPGSHPVARNLHRHALPGSAELPYARFSISYLPFAGALTDDRRPPEGPALIVADTRDDLPVARREVQIVESSIDDAVTLVGNQATRAGVLAALDEARLFHFAGHGTITPANAWDAHLRLAGGERLSVEDVLMQRPRVGLVVLSACESAVETPLSNREELGLAELFFVLGARAVVATDAPVTDAEAARFMANFYEGSGLEAPAEALRSAALVDMAEPASDSTEGRPTWKLFRVVGFRRLEPRHSPPSDVTADLTDDETEGS